MKKRGKEWASMYNAILDAHAKLRQDYTCREQVCNATQITVPVAGFWEACGGRESAGNNCDLSFSFELSQYYLKC